MTSIALLTKTNARYLICQPSKLWQQTRLLSIDGVIPINATSKKSSVDSEFIHHWTNMGITVPL